MPAAERGSPQRAWANRRSRSYPPGQNGRLNPAAGLSKTIRSQAYGRPKVRGSGSRHLTASSLAVPLEKLGGGLAAMPPHEDLLQNGCPIEADHRFEDRSNAVW